MPETITCPECAKTLRVPDSLLGKTVRCPSCKATFTATGGEQPNQELVFDDKPAPSARKRSRDADVEEDRPSRRRESRRDEAEDEERVSERRRARRPADDEEDRPRRRRRRDDEDEDDEDEGRRRRIWDDRGSKSDWMRVRQGLGFILAAVFTVVGAYLFLCCGMVAAGAAIAGAASKNSPGGAAAGGVGIIAVFGIFFLAAFAGLVLLVVGNCFCLKAPPRFGANTLAKVSLGLLAGAIFFMLAGTIINATGQGMAGASPLSVGVSGAGQIINLMGELLCLAQYIVFLFFLRAVCQAIQDYQLAKRIVYLIVFFVASLVITVLTAFIMFFLAGMSIASTSGVPPVTLA